MREIPKSAISFWFANNLIITSLGSFSSNAYLRISYSGVKTDFYQICLCYYCQASHYVVKGLLSNVALPHPDLPIMKPLIPLGSNYNDYNVYLGFHSNRDFLLPFYIYHFLFFTYNKMYCSKCRCVTETENITTATSKNGRLVRRGQCITCGKTKTPLVTK